MNQKFIRIIKLVTGLIFTVSVLFFLMIQLQTPTDSYGLLEPILGVKNFNTSAEHKKALGIETANISEEEKKKLDGMIEEVIRAQEEYNATKKEKSLDKIKNLYLPEVFETHKEEAKKLITNYPVGAEDSKETLKFSSPRTYKDLSSRVGIISYIDFSFSQYLDAWPRGILQVFIFKNTNGEWKIEKQQVSNSMAEKIKEGLEATELGLVKQIMDQ